MAVANGMVVICIPYYSYIVYTLKTMCDSLHVNGVRINNILKQLDLKKTPFTNPDTVQPLLNGHPPGNE